MKSPEGIALDKVLPGEVLIAAAVLDMINRHAMKSAKTSVLAETPAE